MSKQNYHTMSQRHHSEPYMKVRTFQPDRKINDMQMDEDVEKQYKNYLEKSKS